MAENQEPNPQPHVASLKLPFPELVSQLRNMLGVRLVAYIGGVKSTRSVSSWAEGTGVPGEVDQDSHPSKVQLVADAAEAGYLVHLHVIMVPVELTVQRVRERVRRGGHDVPESKIRDRYERL